MRFYTTKPLQFLFPQIMWKGPTDAVYLTFDDGPHPIATPFALQDLSLHGIKATFFLLGSNVERQPDLAKRIVAEGHTLGNHGYDHTSLLFRDSTFVADQITRTSELIQKYTGVITRYFRPPFGHANPITYRTARDQKHEIVMWDVDSGDWEDVDADTIVRRSVHGVAPGSILLFHDNDHTQHKVNEILMPFIGQVRARNLRFAPLPI